MIKFELIEKAETTKLQLNRGIEKDEVACGLNIEIPYGYYISLFS